MTLITTIPQTDGITRYLLHSDASIARAERAALRADPAYLECVRHDTMVERSGGRLIAYRWPQTGVPCAPPWAEIDRALGGE